MSNPAGPQNIKGKSKQHEEEENLRIKKLKLETNKWLFIVKKIFDFGTPVFVIITTLLVGYKSDFFDVRAERIGNENALLEIRKEKLSRTIEKLSADSVKLEKTRDSIGQAVVLEKEKSNKIVSEFKREISISKDTIANLTRKISELKVQYDEKLRGITSTAGQYASSIHAEMSREFIPYKLKIDSLQKALNKCKGL